MPTVLNEKGYRFFFFSNEGDPLEPCHIHVRKNGSLAKFWVDENCSLANNNGFSSSELSEIAYILNKNIKTIKEAWNGFFFE